MKRAFTLVELLVVIGIIALLVGILLPALNAARRSANTVKCATAMREIGHAIQMYADENRGYAPPAKTKETTAGLAYVISYTNWSPPVADTTHQQYWMSFIAKYVTRTKVGSASLTSSTVADPQAWAAAMGSILWGCPAWTAYARGQSAGVDAVTQTGYGFNAFPEYTGTYPPPNQMLGDNPAGLTCPDLKAIAVLDSTDGWRTITEGRWYKYSKYTSAPDRVVVTDGTFWLLEVSGPTSATNIPGSRILDNSGAVAIIAAAGQNTFDFYRHGHYPRVAVAGAGGSYDTAGGKVAYNMLFSDGHVSTSNDRAEGYRASRMRFPN